MNSTDFVGFHSAIAVPAPRVKPIRQDAPTPMDETLCDSFNFSSVSCRPRGCIARRMALFCGGPTGARPTFCCEGFRPRPLYASLAYQIPQTLSNGRQNLLTATTTFTHPEKVGTFSFHHLETHFTSIEKACILLNMS